MSIITKLNTLFRASAREAAEQVVDANAIRIYEQEIIDAESVLTQRRGVMAAMIANRRELEQDIERLRESISRREQELDRLPDEERSEKLLMLAAEEIAGSEEQLETLKAEHRSLSDSVRELELTLRSLIREIRTHRRDLKLLRNQDGLQRANGGAATLNGRLQALRQTRASIGERVQGGQHLEAGVAETAQRLDESPLQRSLDECGASDRAAHVARVLDRLRGETSTS